MLKKPMNKYFNRPNDESSRLPRRVEALMIRNLRGKLSTNREWEILHKGVVMAYSTNGELGWGQKMEGYECGKCEKAYINTWAYGPVCPDNLKIGMGCENLSKVQGVYAWKQITDLEALAAIARELPCAIIGKARETTFVN